MTIQARRCWINQPSTLQPLHKHHGQNVIAVPYTNNAKAVYFLAGDTISMVVPSEVLAEGWNPATQPQAADPDEGLEIQRTLVVSTAHLPRQFREWLNAQNRCNEGVLWEVPPLAINQNPDQEPLRLIVDPIDDYGWRICVTEEGVNEYAKAVHGHDPLLELLRLAQKHDCQWLALDRDGDEVDGLSTFEE